MGILTTLFGGPSQQQQNLASSEQALSGAAQNGFSQELQSALGTQNIIGQQLNPIFQGGPSQQGESAQELAAQNTAAINNAGAASRNAEQAVGAQLAGQGGGGTSGLQSGIEQQIRGSIASAGANQLAGAQNEIVQHNYDVGNQNFWKAAGGESALAGEESSTGANLGNLASSANKSAAEQAGQIQSEKGSVIGDLTKVAGLAGSFLTGGVGNLDNTGSSSFGENVGNFFSGGARALAGK